MANEQHFGLQHLLAWLQQRDRATRATRPRAAAALFSTVTMSSLRDGNPPMRPGGLFVAIRATRDGHDFVADAFANGARAALAARIPDQLRAALAARDVAVLDFRSGVPPHPLAPSPTMVAPPHPPAPSPLVGEGEWNLQRSTAPRPTTLAPLSLWERGPGGEGKPLLLLVDDPVRTLQACAAWWRRQHAARVLAITGSVGKTTAKDLLANVLEQRYRVLRTEGNFNNEYGLPFMLLRLAPSIERAVLEIGISAVGEMATFAGIAAPHVAVVTRVAPAHLAQFGDVDTVEREKGRLVEALSPDGVAILNVDDDRVARMAQRAPGRCLFFGERARADVRAAGVAVQGLEGIEFTLRYGDRSARVRVPLAGRHFVSAALAAAAGGFEEGCTWDEVIAGLAQPLDARRLRPVVLPDGVTILNDTYNASPVATKAALDLLASLPGRRIAILGDMLEMGESAAPSHYDVGAYATGRADELVTAGEFAGDIAHGARDAGFDAQLVYVAASVDDAAAHVQPRLRRGDYVLIKGSRSMRMDRIVRALAGEHAPAEGHH
ncbi:MAG: UDP-N-acetylmuramoyl-tripeptide--D-alanyl-D-alanine ligase [Chloroflexi bacterium]|nr:UDP-N-acetylmuramoyl-tripeptide--D-alanyl-D-alanine ligase [Chloroflexota bacterium]